MTIHGKKAIITGASSGIGRAAARMLASKGVDVALLGRDRDRLDAATSEIKAHCPVRTVCCPSDLMVEQEAEEAIEFAVRELGGLDFLLNCAGVSQRSACMLAEAETAEFHRIMRSNVDSILFCCRTAIPYLRQSKGAYIISILSTAAFSTGVGGRNIFRVKICGAGFARGPYCPILGQ